MPEVSGVRRLVVACAVTLAGSMSLGAQEATDLFWVELGDGEGAGVSEVRNLTKRAGYDNQPAFSADGSRLFYTSQRGEGEKAQTDVWVFDLGDEEASPRALFTTPESEYSPTPIPGEQALSVIRVEADGAQKLWRLPLDGGRPSRILDRVEPVGYHAWVGDELVLFVLGEPHELQRVLADRTENLGRVIAKDIGRALHKIPGEDAFSFLQKTPEGWWIRKLDLKSDETEPLIKALDGREDFTWGPDGKLWAADGSKIFRACPTCGEGWQPVVDLADRGIAGITRMAVHPGGRALVIVAEHRP